MSFNKIFAILKKQLKDTLKNKSILIQFVMFPILTIILANSIELDGMPENFFVNLFAIMYVGMAPLVSVSTIISEEKECDTLRVLLMSNVKAVEYLLGISFYVVVLCTAGAFVIGLQGNFTSTELNTFMLVMFFGIVVSTLIGAAVGIISKNQMGATSISVPLMMIFAFVPMISMFNEAVKTYSQYIYTQQMSDILYNIQLKEIENTSMLIMGLNALLAGIIFIFMFRKKGLEN